MSDTVHELEEIRRLLVNIYQSIGGMREQINSSTNVIRTELDEVNSSIDNLKDKLIESTNSINKTINYGITMTISESILREYADAYSKVVVSRLQLNVLRERLEEVNQRYYNNYKNIVVDYLRNIYDFLNQFINMSEQEFNILKKLLRLAKAAEDINNEVKPDWINKELIEVVSDSNIKKRLEDLSNFTERLREIHSKLTEAENSINNVESSLRDVQLPMDVEDDITVYVPITIVEVEVNGNSHSYSLRPAELDGEVLDQLLERAGRVKDGYPWKIDEKDIDGTLKMLQSIAESDDEHELISKIKVLQVN